MLKTSQVPTIILAPHPDDELIGCWSYLKAGLITHVIYFSDITPVRLSEIEKVADHFKLTYSLNPSPEYLEELLKDQVVLIPSIKDSHPKHKEINLLGRSLVRPTNRLFYSVDMVSRKLLADAQEKLVALNQFYGSQKALWESNAAYYLFESITDTDYTTLNSGYTSIGGYAVLVETDACIPEVSSSAPDLIDTLLGSGATYFTFTYRSTRYQS